MTNVEAKGYLFPSRSGQHAIVVSTKQGQNPVKNHDSELVPVGAGKLQEGGSPAISNIELSGKSQMPFQYDQAYRVRVYMAVDRSTSMTFDCGDGSQNRLELVKDKISTLVQGLNDLGCNDLEHILVPFSRTSEIACRTKDTQRLIQELSKLETSGGTDIASAISLIRKDIRTDKNNQARNLMILISDGDHRRGREDVSLQFNSFGLYGADCAVYAVGVGKDYNKLILSDILQMAKFGGLTHLPHPKLGVFKDILPPFIAGMRTAPHYPVVSFNNRFQRVVNMMPSVRDVIEEKYDNDLLQLIPNVDSDKHFPAVAGYMLENYAVGFVRDADLGKASICLLVQDDPNAKPFEVKEIIPVPFDEAILDPAERELIKGMPLNVRLVEVLERRDLQLLEKFIKDNFDDLNKKQKELILKEIKNLKGPTRTAQGETCTRESATEAASDVSERVFKRPVNELSNLADDFRDDSNLGVDENSGDSPSLEDLLHSGELGPLDRSGVVGSLPHVQGPSDVNAAAYGKAMSPIKVTFENLFPEPGLTISNNSIEITQGKTFVFGRGTASDVVISGNGSVSRNHFSVLRDGDDIYVRDNGSSNGTFVNGQRIVSDTILKSGDILSVSGINLKVTIKT